MPGRLNRLPPLDWRDYALAAIGTPAAAAPAGQYYYGYARNALFDALVRCGCRPGDTVLYPETICDVTLEPAHRLGLQVAFYPVCDGLLPHWGRLKKMIAASGAVVVMSVNYFGFAQPMDRWRRLARETGAAWINDNAHGCGSRHDGIPLEAFGDVSITSMRKVLPLINGATLRVNRPAMMAPSALFQGAPGPRPRLPNAEEWRRLRRSVAAATGADRRPPAATALYETLPAAAERDARDGAMGRLSRRVLARLDRQMPELVRRRRRIYNTWHRHCADAGLKPVYPALPTGVSPMVYPCYARDFAERQKWLKWAAAKNVDVYPWPSLPERCRQAGSPALDRWRRLLCFPIHGDMDPRQIGDRWP